MLDLNFVVVSSCPGHSGEKRGGAFNQPPPVGELPLTVGKDASKTPDCKVLPLSRQLTGADAARWSVPVFGWQHPHLLVDTGGEGCCQVEDRLPRTFLACASPVAADEY